MGPIETDGGPLTVQEAQPLTSSCTAVQLVQLDAPAPAKSSSKKKSRHAAVQRALARYPFFVRSAAANPRGDTCSVTVQGHGVFLYSLLRRQPVHAFTVASDVVFGAPAVHGQAFGEARQFIVVAAARTLEPADARRVVWSWPLEGDARPAGQDVLQFPEPLHALVALDGRVVAVGDSGALYEICGLTEISEVAPAPADLPAGALLVGAAATASGAVRLVWLGGGRIVAVEAPRTEENVWEWRRVCDVESPVDSAVSCVQRDDVMLLVGTDGRIAVVRIDAARQRAAASLVISLESHGFSLAPGRSQATGAAPAALLSGEYAAVVVSKTTSGRRGAPESQAFLAVWDLVLGTLQLAQPLVLANLVGAAAPGDGEYDLGLAADGTLVLSAALGARGAAGGASVDFDANVETLAFHLPARPTLLAALGKTRGAASTGAGPLREQVEAAAARGNAGAVETAVRAFLDALQGDHGARLGAVGRIAALNSVFRTLMSHVELLRAGKSGAFWPAQAIRVLLETGHISSMAVQRGVLVPMVAERDWGLLLVALERLADAGEFELVAVADALVQPHNRASLVQWTRASGAAAAAVGAPRPDDSDDDLLDRATSLFLGRLFGGGRALLADELVAALRRLSFPATDRLLEWASSAVAAAADADPVRLAPLLDLYGALLDAQAAAIVMAPAADSTASVRLASVRDAVSAALVRAEQLQTSILPLLRRFDDAWQAHRRGAASRASSGDSERFGARWSSLAAQGTDGLGPHTLEVVSLYS